MKRKRRHLFSHIWLNPTVEGRVGFRERKSNFSLNFPAIELSNFGEARRKVALRDKGYVWTPILWSFDNSGSRGLFLLGLFSVRLEKMLIF